ncbi:MAG: hypothetical protein Q4C46_06495 [Bacillota bacterium]|nr:hypothetical protein [Bacillota bacterium]
MLNNKTVLKICSLVIAVCLWVYVIGEVNPESRKKISNIEVSFTNTEVLAERGLAVADEETVMISAVIEGKRSDVNDAKKRGISAHADVSKCKEGSNTVDIVVNLPDGVRLDSVSEDKIKVKVTEKVSEERNVKIEFSGETDSQSELAWVIDFSPETVYVSGAANLVKKVDYVKGTVNIDKVDTTLRNLEAELTPVDEDGNEIEGVETSYKIAYADVQLLASKEIRLSVKAENTESDVTIDKIDAPGTIRIVGDKDVINEIHSVEGTVDMKGMTASGKAEIIVDLPDGVYLYDNSISAGVSISSAQ